MSEVRLKHAYAFVHRVWFYESSAHSSELCAVFNLTHAAHDYAKLASSQDQPKDVCYTVTELDDGKQTFYRKEDKDNESRS